MALQLYKPKIYFRVLNLPELPTNPDFVNKENKIEDDRYTCAYCQQVLYPHILQLVCGHRFHESCYFKILKEGKFKGCPKQEDEECCKVDLDSYDSVWPDIATEQYFGKKMVYCSFKESGCSKTVPWSELKSHCLVCENSPHHLNKTSVGEVKVNDLSDRGHFSSETTIDDSGKNYTKFEEEKKEADEFKDLKGIIEKEELSILELKENNDELKGIIERQQEELDSNKLKDSEQITEIDNKEKRLASLKNLYEF